MLPRERLSPFQPASLSSSCQEDERRGFAPIGIPRNLKGKLHMVQNKKVEVHSKNDPAHHPHQNAFIEIYLETRDHFKTS